MMYDSNPHVYNPDSAINSNPNLDEVMIWDNVISTSSITTLANAVGSGNIVNPEQLSTGLQLWNRMGD